MNSITCRVCQSQNPEGNKFCHNCGTSLKPLTHITCPNCFHSNPVQLVYCDNCGQRLEQASEPATGPLDNDPLNGGLSSSISEPFSLPSRRPGETGDLDPDRLPEWLREYTGSLTSSNADGDPEPEETPPADEGGSAPLSVPDSGELFPDWLQEGTGAGGAAGGGGSDGDDWLSMMASDPDGDDPSSGEDDLFSGGDLFESTDESALDELSEPDLSGFAFDDSGMSDLELTDWLSDAGSQDVESLPAREPSADPIFDTLPDWMRDDAPLEGLAADFDLTSSEPESTETPDFMSDFSFDLTDDIDLDSPEMTNLPADEPVDQAQSSTGFTSWLADGDPIDVEAITPADDDPDIGILADEPPAGGEEDGDTGLTAWLTAATDGDNLSEPAIFEESATPAFAFDDNASPGFDEETPFVDSFASSAPLEDTEDWLDSLSTGGLPDLDAPEDAEVASPALDWLDEPNVEGAFATLDDSAMDALELEGEFQAAEGLDSDFQMFLTPEAEMAEALSRGPEAVDDGFEAELARLSDPSEEELDELPQQTQGFAPIPLDEDDFFGELSALGEESAAGSSFSIDGVPDWITQGAPMAEDEYFREAGGPLDELVNVIPLSPIMTQTDTHSFIRGRVASLDANRAETSAWRGAINELTAERPQAVPSTATRPKPSSAVSPLEKRENQPTLPEFTRRRSTRALAMFLLMVFFLYFLSIYRPELIEPFEPYLQTGGDIYNFITSTIQGWLP